MEGVEDLVLLPKVTEEGITDNIKKRYMLDKIYVRKPKVRSTPRYAPVLSSNLSSLALLLRVHGSAKRILSEEGILMVFEPRGGLEESKLVFGGSRVLVCVLARRSGRVVLALTRSHGVFSAKWAILPP